MMADINEKFSKVFDEMVCAELKQAEPYATHRTVVLRVLFKCCELAKVNWQTLAELKNHIHIHPDSKRAIQKMWMAVHQKNIFTQDETNTFERFMSKDFFKPWDLGRLITILSKKCPKNDLNRLLAVDGFSGEDFKNYSANLHYGNEGGGDDDEDFKGVHVRAVRKLYDEFKDLSIDRVNKMLYFVLDGGKSVFKADPDICEFYRRQIGDHASKILKWKNDQMEKEKQQQEKKNNESKKRKCEEESKKETNE